MLFHRPMRHLATASAFSALMCSAAWAAAPRMEFGRQAASADARYAVQWVLDAADNNGLPFAVVDKKAARLFVFEAGGRLLGESPALLGLAVGDTSAPDVGILAQTYVPPQLRTTPAGRFDSEPGRNQKGEDVVRVDYDAAFAIHRLRPGAGHARRTRQPATSTPLDNRASLGCVVVPAAFYDSIVKHTLGSNKAVVYVLPETRPVQDLFTTMQLGWNTAR